MLLMSELLLDHRNRTSTLETYFKKIKSLTIKLFLKNLNVNMIKKLETYI